MEGTPENKPKGNVKRIKRVLLILLFVLVLIVSILMVLAPGMAKNYINKNGEVLVGRKIQIDKVKLNYFTSTLQIIGFQLFEQNKADVFIEFDTLLIDMKPLKFFGDEIYVQQLQIVNSDASLIQNGTNYNFTDLFEFFESDSLKMDELTESTQQKKYKLNLHNIELIKGSLSYTDKIVDHTLNVLDVSFIIPQIYWNQPDSSKAALAFNLPKGGSFGSSLKYNMDLGIFSGTAKIEKLELEAFLPYIKQYLNVADIDGTFATEIAFSGTDKELSELQVNGRVRIDSLGIKDETERKVLGAQQIKVDVKSMEPLKQNLEVDLIQLDKPHVYFELLDSISNFEKMLVTFSEQMDTIYEDAEIVNDTSDYPMEIAINHFVVKDGLIDFSDQRFREEFLYELSEVSIDMDTIELKDNWVNINANMKLHKRGNLDAQIGMNPSAVLDSIQLDYVLSDFQLSDLNIYSKHYVGLPILFGDMYYVSKTSIVHKQLKSENELIMRNVELGRKGGGLYDVPIKLALFIMKDIKGDITLDVPVQGDLSDPKTRIGPILWDTFKGFMVKIVASPFKALGNLLGADPKDVEELAFDYGDSTLVRKQIKTLDLLLELEQLKPELQIDLHYLNDKVLERTDVAREIGHQLYFQEKNQTASSHTKDYLEFMALKTGQDSLLMQDYEMLLAPSIMLDSMLDVRQLKRIENVRNYLIEKNDSTSIRVLKYNKEEILNIGSRPRIEVRYVLAEDVQE